MKYPIEHYTTLVFDCDGVILNSNRVKSDAFYQAALPYGQTAAQALVDYHVARGGISRYKKFDHFLERIVPSITGPDLDSLLVSYSEFVRRGLLSCEITPGLSQLRQKIPNSRWLIVSGGDQCELRDIFTQRGLAELFDVGIFGSPDSKDEILAREQGQGNIQQPAIFLGDSKYDHQAASTAGLEFLFLSNWSEVMDWRDWTSENNIESKQSIMDLL